MSRAILWRSATVRRLAGAITGLHFETPKKESAASKDKSTERLTAESELTKALQKSQGWNVSHRRTGSTKSAGVKFTFILYENQRRWVGLGWTNSLFAYERSAWTDEHNNAVSPKEDFELPEVEDGAHVKWQWVEGSRWRVDGVQDDHGTVDYDGDDGRKGWVYYDNKVSYLAQNLFYSTLTPIVAKRSSWPGRLGKMDTKAEVVSRCRAGRSRRVGIQVTRR